MLFLSCLWETHGPGMVEVQVSPCQAINRWLTWQTFFHPARNPAAAGFLLTLCRTRQLQPDGVGGAVFWAGFRVESGASTIPAFAKSRTDCQVGGRTSGKKRRHAARIIILQAKAA